MEKKKENMLQSFDLTLSCAVCNKSLARVR